MKARYLIGFFFVTSAALSQNSISYNVVKVAGKVESAALKRLLTTGDVITDRDRLTFSSEGDYLIVTSPQTGRKTISGVKDQSPQELLQLMQSFLKPAKKATSSRSISLEYIEHVQNGLSSEILLILGDGHIPIDTNKLSLTAPAVVKAWCVVNNKMIYRKISDQSGFSLSRTSLFGETLPDSMPKVTVEYLESENGNEDPIFSDGVRLATFLPLYTDENQLTKELRTILSSLKDKNSDQRISEIMQYLVEVYAPAQIDNLRNWLREKGLQ